MGESEIGAKLSLDPTDMQKGAAIASGALKQVATGGEATASALAKTEQATQKTSAGFHRGSLFMLNFSRGVEDLKFGLPAVINNLDAIGFSFSLMAKEAKEAGQSVTGALFRSLASPAGVLAGVNLIITGIVLLGDKINILGRNAKESGGELEDMVKAASSAIDIPGLGKASVSVEQVGFALASVTSRLNDVNKELSSLSRDIVTSLREDAERFSELSGEAYSLNIAQSALLETAKEARANAIVANALSAAGITLSKEQKDALSGLRDEIAKDAEEWRRLTDSGVELFGIIGAPDSLGRIQNLQDHIRKLVANGISPASDEVRGLSDEMRTLLNLLSGGGPGIFKVPVQQDLVPPQKGPSAPTKLVAPKGLDRTVSDLRRMNEEIDRMRYSLQDGVNEELKQTQILINTMPLSAIEGLSVAIGDAAGNILTLQGGFDDLGKSLVNAFRNIVAEMVGLIIKQKLLNALKMEELATTQAIAAAGGGASIAGAAGAGGSLGTAGLVAGGVLLAAGVLSALGVGRKRAPDPRDAQIIYGGGGDPSRRMAVSGVVLTSGDIEFSVSERRATNRRVGR